MRAGKTTTLPCQRYFVRVNRSEQLESLKYGKHYFLMPQLYHSDAQGINAHHIDTIISEGS